MCLLCCEPLTFVGLGECGHRTCCSKCTLRWRMLHKDASCVVCKQPMERVFVVRVDDERTHDALVQQTWGRVASRGLEFDEATSVYFADAAHRADTPPPLRQERWQRS